MPRLRYAVPCLLLAACKFGDDRPLGGDASIDASIDASLPGSLHLLLTEVYSEGNGDEEFVEIWNPTSKDIELHNYFISDMGNYWRYPSGTLPASSNDFVVSFPSGAIITSNQTVVVAMRSSTFQTRFSRAATYAMDLTSDTGTTRAMVTNLGNTDPVSGARANITNSNLQEYIILFYWDRSSDLVKDVDIIIAGTSTMPGNALVTKAPVDGPDSNSEATSYKQDRGTLAMARVANGPESYKRRVLENGSETQDGMGNGIAGDDETTEALGTTWDGANSAPTPGVLPASLSQ